MEKARGRTRAVVGALVWVLLLSSAQLLDPLEGRNRRALSALSSYLFGRQVAVLLRFPEEVEIGVGDPVYHSKPEGTLTPVGEVRALLKMGQVVPLSRAFRGDGVREVECSIRLPRGPASRVRAKLHNLPQNASWVLRTLLPPEKLVLIGQEWNRTLLEHREEIFSALGPVLREVVRDVQEVLAADLPAALEARHGELAPLGRRLLEEIVKREFEPLARTELWPVLKRRADPTLRAIGEEVWKRLPLWSLTWRFLYQSLPLTSDDYLKGELVRFFCEETIPTLREHADDFLGIVQDIVREAARNPRVGEAFRRSFERLLGDPDLQHQLRLVFQEVVLDNPRFHEAMARRWASPEVAGALEVLSRRLEPMVRRIGDLVLGTRWGGITPEFARVLRTQILEKDRRWVLLEDEAAGSPLEGGSVVPGEIERR